MIIFSDYSNIDPEVYSKGKYSSIAIFAIVIPLIILIPSFKNKFPIVTLSILEEWKKQQKKDNPNDDLSNQLIFMNPKTKSHFSLEVRRRWQQKINVAIDLDHNVTLHVFRHTHGTLLLDNNYDLTFKDLQKRLGHKNLQTTINTYLHSTNKSDSKMVKALQKVDNISNDLENNKNE
ncbi:tyrosine-type recombinase/integrase [Companilactobacillus sp. FL22-1]|uniref:tyrosine-type recombinase/integrase n=1 Tax=Companilactobacillus sp. FL22-1 TaxID=3373892 RepID=UPI003754234E